MSIKNCFLDNKLKIKNVEFFIVALYFIAITAHQLGTGFDAFFVRGIFGVMVLTVLIVNKKFTISNIFNWSLVFWGFYFTSCIWAENVNDTLKYVNNAIQIVFIFLILPTIIKDKEDLNKILKLLLISLFYTAIVILIRTPLSQWGIVRIGRCVGLHPNAIGIRMAIGVIISLFFCHEKFKENNKKGSIKYIIFMIIGIILVLFSGSRKALALTILGVVGFEVFNSTGKKRILKIVSISIIFIILLVLIFNNEQLYSVMGIRIERVVRTLIEGENVSENDRAGSLIERIFFIRQAIDLFRNNPLIGYGGNNFATWMRNIEYENPVYSHNNFVELLSTLGIVGFAIYYFFFGKVLLGLLHNIKINKDDSYSILFFTLMIMMLILDLGSISYAADFNAIIFCFAYICVNLNKVNSNEINNKKNQLICNIKSLVKKIKIENINLIKR